MHPKNHGIAVPITALHSKNSCGNGEILDLLPVLDWMEAVGFNTLQFLPLTDSGADSSPYSAISTTAIHPILLSLHALPNKIEPLPTFEKQLRFNYGLIRNEKLGWIRRYVQANEDEIRHQENYTHYLESTPWIHSYGKFVALKEKNDYKPWWEWTTYEVTEEEIRPYLLMQYLLDQQLKKVREEANKRGISLLGDSPLLLSRDSVKYFDYRHLFIEGATVGVPPDYYNSEGQAWGFPPINWHEVHKENYPIFTERLAAAERYFDLFRIDHIIGFFRFWYIPDGKTPKEGYYVPGDFQEALKQGEYLIRWMIDHTNMKIMGEDLGIIPPEVRQIMHQLDVPGLRVMRWERDYHQEGHPFISQQNYEPISITTVSTHDSESLSEWWITYPDDARSFAHAFHIPYHETLSTEMRYQLLKISHHTTSQYHINPLQEYLDLIFEWQFERPSLERINIPGTISPFNWTFQILPSVEEWTSDVHFQKKVASLLH